MAQQSTLAELLRQRAQAQAESPSFIFRSRDHERYVLSWSRLYRLAGRFAARLHSRGLGRGQLVVNTLVNSPERVVCEAGLWLSGAASVNGHCQMADGSDLLHTLRVSRASALLVDPDVSNSPWNVLSKHVAWGQEDSVTSPALKDLKKVFFIRRVEGGGVVDFISQLDAQNDWFQADITPEDTLTVFTTSGTTGFSKLVVYTHDDYIQPLLPFAQNELLVKNSRVMFKSAPLGWIGGYVGMSMVVYHTSVICDVRGGGGPNDMPEFIRNTIEQEKCDSAVIAPNYISRLAQIVGETHEKTGAMDNSQRSKMSKLNFLFLVGLPISRAIMATALSLAQKVIVSYGATDFSTVSFCIVTDSDSYMDFDTGPPVEGVSVKIVSQDDEDTVLPVNQVGNILIKGATNNHGFLSDPAVDTHDLLTKDGFIRTQDVGRLDERGHLIVEGRGSDAIMRGPYIFYPTWMESCIQTCQGVCDVIITGIPDPVLNEELCACVVLNSGSVTLEQVRHFVKKVVVATEDDPMSPRPRFYLEFSSFPMTDSGKPKRKLIKAQAADIILTTA